MVEEISAYCNGNAQHLDNKDCEALKARFKEIESKKCRPAKKKKRASKLKKHS